MKKLAENCVIRTVGQKLLEVTQTDENFTWKEILEHDLDLPELFVCVSTEKFLATYSKDSKLSVLESGLEIRTAKMAVVLPYMKEYGVFSTVKEIDEEPEDNLEKEYSANYSKVDLDLTDAQGQYSYVLINEGFVCRYLYNTLSFYGPMNFDYFCMVPKQFKLLKQLGDCQIKKYLNTVVATSNSSKVIFKLFRPVLDLNLIRKFFHDDYVCEFTAPKFDVKKLKLFTEEKIEYKCVEADGIWRMIVSVPGYVEAYELEDCTGPFHAKFDLKDLEFMSGHVKFYSQGRFCYAISYDSSSDRTVLFTGEEVRDSI